MLASCLKLGPDPLEETNSPKCRSSGQRCGGCRTWHASAMNDSKRPRPFGPGRRQRERLKRRVWLTTLTLSPATADRLVKCPGSMDATAGTTWYVSSQPTRTCGAALQGEKKGRAFPVAPSHARGGEFLGLSLQLNCTPPRPSCRKPQVMMHSSPRPRRCEKQPHGAPKSSSRPAPFDGRYCPPLVRSECGDCAYAQSEPGPARLF
jgi:hypothetical protein